MSRLCTNCGHSIPEESNFCLYCFTVQHDKSDAEAPPAVTRSTRIKHAFRRNKRRIVAAASAALCMFLAAGILLTGLTRRPEGPAVAAADGTIVKPQEEKSKLEKIVDKIFHPDDETSEQSDESFFDILFGDDEGPSQADTQPADGGEEESGGWGNFWDKLFGGKDQEEKPTEPPADEPGENTPTTQGPTEPNEPTEPDTPAEPEFDSFEYEPDPSSSKGVRITKYTGNATQVTVPAVLGGKFVTTIGEGTFQNNSKITKITFEGIDDRPSLSLNFKAIDNLSALTEIELPDENLGISLNSIFSCPRMRNIVMPDNFQFRFWEGGLYYYSGKEWSMRYYCPDYPATELVIPSWSVGIESFDDFRLATHITKIYYHKNVYRFNGSRIPETLESFEVEDGNVYAYDVNGYLVASTSYLSTIYCPPQNKTKIFHMPENCDFDTFGAIPNPFLEEIYVPASSRFTLSRDIFPNLSTLYLEEGHVQESYLRSNFKGNIYIY